MANTIQIKRSLLSVAPSSLAEGEFAYVYGTDTLYLGAPSNTMIIVGGYSTFAKLASPTFTGTPLAPTAAGGTNTTQIATTAYVLAAIASGGITIDAVPTDGSNNAVSSNGTYDAIALKANIASPTFTGTVSGVTKTMVGLANVDNTADTSKPVSTAQQTALDLKANLASPTLTGTPLAPTAANATNTTQIATTAFVKSVINDLLNGAGAAYDTLKELQDLLVADEGTVSALTTTVAGKLAIASNLSDLNNAGTARTNLGLGTMATQAASAVAITGGTISGTTIDAGTF